MSNQELIRLQQEFQPKEDLTPYDGEWVLLHDGYVIAHGTDPVRLRAQATSPDDPLLPVAISPSGILY